MMSLNLEETYKMNESLRKLSKNTNQLHTEPKCGQRWRHDDSTLWPIKKNHNNLCKAHIFTLITIVCCTLKKKPTEIYIYRLKWRSYFATLCDVLYSSLKCMWLNFSLYSVPLYTDTLAYTDNKKMLICKL